MSLSPRVRLTALYLDDQTTKTNRVTERGYRNQSVNVLELSTEQLQYTHRLPTVVGVSRGHIPGEDIRGVPRLISEDNDFSPVVVGKESTAKLAPSPANGPWLGLFSESTLGAHKAMVVFPYYFCLY